MSWEERTEEDVQNNVIAAIEEGMMWEDIEKGRATIQSYVNHQVYKATGASRKDAIDNIVHQVMGGMRR